MAFTKSVSKEYTFDEAVIKVSFKRMSRVDAMLIAPNMEQLQAGEGIKIKFSDEMDFISKSSQIIGNCVTSVSGLVIDGKPVGIADAEWKDDVLGGVYFTPLIRDIMGDIMKASFVNGEQAKKSEVPPQGGLTE